MTATERPSDKTIARLFWLQLETIRPGSPLRTVLDCIADAARKVDERDARYAAHRRPTNPAEIGSKSVVEPTADHWRRAIKERGIENPKVLEWIEQRARELASDS